MVRSGASSVRSEVSSVAEPPSMQTPPPTWASEPVYEHGCMWKAVKDGPKLVTAVPTRPVSQGVRLERLSKLPAYCEGTRLPRLSVEA